MNHRAIRHFFVSQAPVLLVIASLIALSACGNSGGGTHVCPLASGCCGATSSACIAPAYVLANGLDGQISVFPVDSATGTLGTPATVSGPTGSLGMTTLNNQFLYLSDFSTSLSNPSSIDFWTFDLTTGALTAGSPYALGPLSLGAGIVSDQSLQIVYVADVGRIDALQADAAGALSPLVGSPFASGTNLYLAIDPQGRFLFAAEYDPPGSVAAFTIDSAGALIPVAGSPFAANPNSSASTQPGEIAVHPSGNFLYVTLAGTNQIAGFSIDQTSGVLTPIAGSPFAAGSNPFTLVVVNNFLYASNAMDGTVSGYRVDAATGVLSPLNGSPFLIRTGAMVADLSATHLYASTASGMMVFQIDGTTGVLTQIGSTIPSSGATVLNFVL